MNWLRLLPGVLLVACGGGGGGADGGNEGPCQGTQLVQSWPDDATAEFCTRSWTTDDPALVLTECGDVFERCSDSGPDPDFSCIDTPPGPPPETPATVTLTGWVDVFSSGPSSDNARLQLYAESALEGVTDLATATAMAELDIQLDAGTLVDARACPKDTTFMQGQCVVPTADCGGACDKEIAAGQFCWQGSCVDLQRWEIPYTVTDVPTNQFLVMRTIGLDGGGNPQVTGNTWSPLVQYNVYLSTADRACADADDRDCIDTTGDPAIYRADVNLLSSQDYMTIPTSAGLSAGITAGNGAIAGEVHDCNGIRLQHAQVGFAVGRSPRVLVYFNGNPVRTLPRLQQFPQGTDPLGLFAGLDLTPGPVSIDAIGVSSGALRETGRFTARIWPDTVTLVRLGANRPPQQ
ncbi:MAG TPA: hypothetical protein VL172_15525 [Kofleriaceae bacterium]|nr:hypothetical protein [Kofleriaceae bacterium]